jgi:hypothetical protein
MAANGSQWQREMTVPPWASAALRVGGGPVPRATARGLVLAAAPTKGEPGHGRGIHRPSGTDRGGRPASQKRQAGFWLAGIMQPETAGWPCCAGRRARVI